MNPVVHFEMPASDKARMISFYEKHLAGGCNS
jgi:predicted enzyme related to lactoylglutathione lyase